MLGIFAQTDTTFTYDTAVTTTDTGEAAALFGIGVAVILIFTLIIYLASAFVMSFIFTKASKPMWAAYVPIYNSWVLFEIAGKPGWWVLVNFIPLFGNIVFFVLSIIATLELAKRFGKSVLFAVLGLIFFPIIGYVMLAFGKAQYSANEDSGQTGFVPPVAPSASEAPTSPVQSTSDQTSATDTVPQAPPQPMYQSGPNPNETPTPVQQFVPQPPVQQPQDNGNNSDGTPPSAPAGPTV